MASTRCSTFSDFNHFKLQALFWYYLSRIMPNITWMQLLYVFEHHKLQSFFVAELLPWLRDRYSISHDPNQTVITASGYGGLAAALAAISYPNLFEKVLCQSVALL